MNMMVLARAMTCASFVKRPQRGSAKIKSSTDTSPEMATEAYIVRRTQRSVDSVSPPPI